MAVTRNTQPIRYSDATTEPGAEIRERVYKAIAVHVAELRDGATEKTTAFGRDVLDAVIEIVVRTAIKEGYFRLPGGFGSFRSQSLKSSLKRLPTGEVIELSPNRMRLRYEEGAAVRELLGMPYKTSYRRKQTRRSKLTKQAASIAFPDQKSA
jgi:hypothetical protein